MIKKKDRKILQSTAEIRFSAMNLLARREHSRLELVRKLQQRVDDKALLDEALDRLIEDNLLDEERFCEAFVRMRANGGYGPIRVRAELKERGVCDELISRYITLHEADWPKQVIAVFEKKYGLNADADAKIRASQKRFLAQRGFSFEQIKLAFSQCHKIT
jgi:regulatory protein